MSKKLFNVVINMREKDALRVARDLLERGEDPLKVLEFCRQAMDEAGWQNISGRNKFIREV